MDDENMLIHAPDLFLKMNFQLGGGEIPLYKVVLEFPNNRAEEGAYAQVDGSQKVPMLMILYRAHLVKNIRIQFLI